MSNVLIGFMSGALLVLSVVMLLQGGHAWKGPVMLILSILGFYFALKGASHDQPQRPPRISARL